MPHLSLVPLDGLDKTKALVAEALSEAGLVRSGGKDIKEQLNDANLDPSHLFSHLSNIIENGDARDAVRLRALETALKMNGALREDIKPAVSFNVIINNSFNSVDATDLNGVNPILLPREVRP